MKDDKKESVEKTSKDDEEVFQEPVANLINI